ncbi:MAG TPA: polyphosphate kinase 1, partial [Candidatus Hydrogenedentes bacterium]|nr:polyphosphate kinase 1 [Candidatus Hydrogenedentota bacterium]
YAILELPQDLPRFVELPNGRIMYLDDIIRHKLDDVFYIFRYEKIGAFEFKISRDAELDIDNDFSEGYVRKMERVLRQRKGGRPTRFVYDSAMPEGLLKRLIRGLNLGASDTAIGGGRYHNMRDLMRFPVKRPELSFEQLCPNPHPVLDRYRGRMIDLVARQDLLITYPYQSFDHVVRLLREAAIDPEVQEIYGTLYRVANRSQVINALINATRNGKRVFVNVELQARFDEQQNIRISQKLLEERATVTYGVPPMKVHAKVLLIRHQNGMVCGFSTGNFNESTAGAYVDSFLVTAHPELAADAVRLFDFFGQAAGIRALSPPRFRQLLVSPFNLRQKLTQLINAERKKGRDGYIFFKVNHLTDKLLIQKIIAAADAGVQVDLVVRTTYALSPHSNIRAISILDRYLEHQRAYIFGRGDDARVYLSSADLMERNLDWRVEVAFPILDPELRRQALEVMELQIRDNVKARILDQNQTNPYVPHKKPLCRAQYATHEYYRKLAK